MDECLVALECAAVDGHVGEIAREHLEARLAQIRRHGARRADERGHVVPRSRQRRRQGGAERAGRSGQENSHWSAEVFVETPGTMIIEDKLSACQAGFDRPDAATRPMPRETLLDFFADLGRGAGTFLVHDDGFRVREWSYEAVAEA